MTYNNITSNRIHHNNFIHNNGGLIQGYDDIGANFWNDTNEGNYWCEYSPTCTDTTLADGICDVPYSLDGGTNTEDNKILKN